MDITLNDKQKESLMILIKNDPSEIESKKFEIANFLYEITAHYYKIAKKYGVDDKLKFKYTSCSTYTKFGGVDGDNYIVECSYHEDRYEWEDYVLKIPKHWILEMTKSLTLWEALCAKLAICNLKKDIEKLNSELNSVYDKMREYENIIGDAYEKYGHK